MGRLTFELKVASTPTPTPSVPLERDKFSIQGFTDITDVKLAIHQIGYRRNRVGHNWNEIESSSRSSSQLARFGGTNVKGRRNERGSKGDLRSAPTPI